MPSSWFLQRRFGQAILFDTLDVVVKARLLQPMAPNTTEKPTDCLAVTDCHALTPMLPFPGTPDDDEENQFAIRSSAEPDGILLSPPRLRLDMYSRLEMVMLRISSCVAPSGEKVASSGATPLAQPSDLGSFSLAIMNHDKSTLLTRVRPCLYIASSWLPLTLAPQRTLKPRGSAQPDSIPAIPSSAYYEEKLKNSPHVEPLHVESSGPIQFGPAQKTRILTFPTCATSKEAGHQRTTWRAKSSQIFQCPDQCEGL
ncbi:hypothetical protein MRS44_010604 [Fusarium solani]|uniref:uncharacterized protein n=1 Tax=Fusarium solani TaxID=169388 RepID=UPI0032C46AE4|nr:hypothetical protein MRS44_010604 [Fusarium solani]